MSLWLQSRRKLRGNRKGTAIVEFALGSGVLLAVFAGTFEFGYTFLQYNQLQNEKMQAIEALNFSVGKTIIDL